MGGWLSIYNSIHPDDHPPFKSRDIVANVTRRYGVYIDIPWEKALHQRLLTCATRHLCQDLPTKCVNSHGLLMARWPFLDAMQARLSFSNERPGRWHIDSRSTETRSTSLPTTQLEHTLHRRHWMARYVVQCLHGAAVVLIPTNAYAWWVAVDSAVGCSQDGERQTLETRYCSQCLDLASDPKHLACVGRPRKQGASQGLIDHCAIGHR
jgi:hypothetical protein